MIRETYQPDVGSGRRVTAAAAIPPDPRAGVLLAHGLNNDMNNPLLTVTSDRLAAQGVACVRFNFPYREEGRKNADPEERLLSCLQAVHEDALARWSLDPEKFFLGGKSLGARISAQAVSGGRPAAGLVYLGFPLHPPGRPDRSRHGLLRSVDPVPQLFLAGTRDPLCPLESLRALVSDLAGPARLHVIDGGDHSFNLPAEYRRNEDEVLEEIAGVVDEWIGLIMK